MAATTLDDAERSAQRLPKAFRLLLSAVALADECAQEMIASIDAPDLAATGDRIERIEDERRALAALMEDHLRGSLLSTFDPADLHHLSANIALLTHRAARSLYFFALLGSTAPPADLRVLVRVLGDATRELVATVHELAGSRTRGVARGVHTVRRLRGEARDHLGRVLAIAPSTEEVVLWRTVGEAMDAAAAQALAVAVECLRVATKHD